MNTTAIKRFRDTIRNGAVYGPFCKTGDPAMIEAIGHSGFDFCILDMEHGPQTLPVLENLIRAAECAALAPIVRVPEAMPQMIGAVLDIGAVGVQIPQVSNAEAARTAVQTARFFPLGQRGVCRNVRAAAYSTMNKADYFSQANEALIIVQIEGKEGLDAFDDIIEVPGIDLIFVGPYDLSQSLGVPGEVTHPAVVDTVKDIYRRCSAKGMAAGTYVDTIDSARFWRDAGMRYLCYSVDVALIIEAGQAVLTQLRSNKD